MKPTNRRNSALSISDVDEELAIIHESATVSELASVGAPGEWIGTPTRFPACLDEGVVVRRFATVDAGCNRPTIIGKNTHILSGAYVAHDVRIGTDCVIKPGAQIAGCVTIGNCVDVGMGAMIRQHVTVGDRARIGMGAVVIRDVPAGETWVGNPARKISTAAPVDGGE